VDEFLFESREGFCEHFASAFVFLMRAAGVPARVIDRLPGRRHEPGGRPLHGAPVRRARLGRGVTCAAAAGSASTRPCCRYRGAWTRASRAR
jgi:transglutaminase-like putative cysteine protease